MYFGKAAIVFVILLLCLGFAIPSRAQTTWYVDDDAANDPGPGDPLVSDPFEDGSSEHPFDSIQEGINTALDGDTVIVSDGYFVENIDYLGKAISLNSENGPDFTTIDGSSPPHPYYGSVVIFQNDEGTDSILSGFTLTNGLGTYNGGIRYGCGIYCTESSPIIANNNITGNCCEGYGGGIYCDFASPDIINNTIANNSVFIGGGIYCFCSSPIIASNKIVFNAASSWYGGGVCCVGLPSPTIINNLVLGNSCDYDGGGIHCLGSSPTIINNTVTENAVGENGGGIHSDHSTPVITNTIMWGNTANVGSEIYIGRTVTPSTVTINYSDVEGGFSAAYVEPGCTLDWGEGMIDNDPLFVSNPDGDYYLSQTSTGHGSDSPCLDAGSDNSKNICFSSFDGIVCLNQRSTRTDRVLDLGQVDMGYHYIGFPTVSADLTCEPQSGILPYTTDVCVSMENTSDNIRVIAGRMTLTLASGLTISNWRTGYSTLNPLGNYSTCWYQTVPALNRLVGINTLHLNVEDVTFAPYNQPPFLPSGDTDTASCTVMGIAP